MDFEYLKEKLALKDVVPNEVAPLMLAHIGDAVYEVVIRSLVLSEGNRPIEKVHREATSLVNAGFQAKLADILMPLMTEEELDIYKRGRNAKSNTKAKNASVSDYRKATGFEALVGFLYLCNRNDRMLELIKEGINNAKE